MQIGKAIREEVGFTLFNVGDFSVRDVFQCVELERDACTDQVGDHRSGHYAIALWTGLLSSNDSDRTVDAIVTDDFRTGQCDVDSHGFLFSFIDRRFEFHDI